MTLKQALKVICETRYVITVHDINGNYIIIHMDYLQDDKCYGGSFVNALKKRSEIVNGKNLVNYISYNNAWNMIEINVDMID